jgi:hypothetical protein
MSGQRDHAIVSGHPDMRGSDTGVPEKFGKHGFLKLAI